MAELIPNRRPEPTPPPAVLADGNPEQAAEQRYLDALGRLVDEAVEHDRLAILADTLAWTIAGIVVSCGVGAAGDIFRRVGGYIGDLSERRRAQEEAEQAKKEGRAIH